MSLPPAQRILITGAAGDIGSALVRALHAQGHTIWLVDRSVAAASALASELGERVTTTACDFTDAEALAALCARLRSGELLPDVLLYNAGTTVPGPIQELSAGAIDQHIDVNLRAAMHLITAAVPGMLDRGSGHIHATVSMGALMPMRDGACYAATKFGLRGFLGSVAADLLETPVRVTGLYPSAVDTKMLRLEARHGGSALNFFNDPMTVDTVVQATLRCLEGTRLERYLPFSDGLLVRFIMNWPGLAVWLIPKLERFAVSGHERYLAKIGPED